MNSNSLQPGQYPQDWASGQQFSQPQPVYGQDPMSYSQPQPAYGQDPMSYSQPQPAYGQDPMGYSQPQTAYGQDPMSYSQPQPAYGQDPMSYSQPQPAYGQDPMGYSQPQPAYGQDPMGYSLPQPAYGQEQDASVPVYGEEQAPSHDTVQQIATEGPSVKPPKKRLNKVQIGVILVVLVFAGVYLFNMLQPAKSTSALIEAGTLGAHYTATGLIVRSEVPYEAESVTSIEYITSEGRQAGRGAAICNVFSTGYSTKELTTLQDYRDQIRDYQLKLVREETAYDAKMERVTADVLTRAKEVRQIVSGRRGNLINQEALLSGAISVRQEYIVSKYATDQRLSRLLDDEQAQQQRIDSWTKQYVASNACIISFYTDGYEYSMNMETAANFTPGEVRRMVNGYKPAGNTNKTRSTIYRTINDGEWMVLLLMNETTWNPVVGQTYTLQLERYENTAVPAEVDSFTRSGGELLVRLKVRASVEPVLYMRSAECTLSDTVPTLKVPARAIYTQDEMQGVVVAQDGAGVFVPVTVVYSSGNYVFITPVTAGYLQTGMTVLLF